MQFENPSKEKRRLLKGIGKFDKVEIEGKFKCLDSSKTIENYNKLFERSYAKITAYFDSNRIESRENKNTLKNSLSIKL